MRHLVFFATAATLLVGCGKPEKSIHVTETRKLTLHDRHYPGNLQDLPPLAWRRLPGTQFRIINYVTGKDDSVEIVMGESQGQILPNANRWLGQFGLSPLQSLDFLAETTMLGRQAYLVEGSGTYTPGMGKGQKEDYGMIGSIVQSGTNIITLKMTGPADEVEKARADFYQYMSSFDPIEDHFITPPSES